MEVSTKEIQVLEDKVSPLVKASQDYKLATVQDVDNASAILKELRDTERTIEEKRQEFVKPLNQSLKAINETFRRIAQPLVNARLVLSRRVLDWKIIETRRIEAEEARRRKIQEAHEKAGHQISAPVVIERLENKIGNTQTRKVWKFKVVDFSQVPDTFKVLNQVAINEMIRQGIRQIKGLEIYQEEQLSIV